MFRSTSCFISQKFLGLPKIARVSLDFWGGNLLGGAGQGVNGRAGKITGGRQGSFGGEVLFNLSFVARLNSERTIVWLWCVFLVRPTKKKLRNSELTTNFFGGDLTNQTCNESLCSHTLEAGQCFSLNVKDWFCSAFFQYKSLLRQIPVCLILGRQALPFGRS